jgi:CRP-like cAMP-binding protein
MLYDAGKPIEYVHFIETGIASILSVMADGSGVETATIGREGMVPMAAFHGVDRTAEQGMTQVPGSAYRMPVSAFRDVVEQLPQLSRLLHRYTVYLFTFAAQNSGCNRKHSVEQRLARWLLIVQERVSTDEFELTHDFMSQMLGVRRASVSEVLGSFEARGLIRSRRGFVGIVDHTRLQAVACECYAVIHDALHAYLADTGGTTAFADRKLSAGGRSTLTDPA